MSCTDYNGDGAGLAMAIGGSKPMFVTRLLGACVDVVFTAAVCNNSAIACVPVAAFSFLVLEVGGG